MNLLVGGRGAGGAQASAPWEPRRTWASSSLLFREACGARQGRGVGGEWEGESFCRCPGF